MCSLHWPTCSDDTTTTKNGDHYVRPPHKNLASILLELPGTVLNNDIIHPSFDHTYNAHYLQVTTMVAVEGIPIDRPSIPLKIRERVIECVSQSPVTIVVGPTGW